MIKRFALLLLLCAAFAQSADAQDNSTYPYDPAHPISANVTVASDYVFRGITQTSHLPALQGGFDWTPPNGFYTGMWGSNVHLPYSPATLLLDVNLGYVYHPSKDWSLNVGVLYLTFLGDKKLDSLAIPVQGAWKTFSLELDYSPVWEGGAQNYYVVAGWKDKIIWDFKLGTYVGYSRFVGNESESNYADYRISVSRKVLDLEVNLTENYVNHAFINGEAAGSTLVLSVSKFF